jgi:hypothetical protein
MRDRCYRSKHPYFKDYGGRGITVCGAWRRSFLAFYAHMGNCPEGLSLDRIDNEGNYEPGNCKWSTALEQTRNRRTNPQYQGDRQQLTEWQKISLALDRWNAEHGRSSPYIP